jgi:hypothetical protein
MLISLQEICITEIIKTNLDYRMLPKVLKENIKKQKNWKSMWDKSALLYHQIFDDNLNKCWCQRYHISECNGLYNQFFEKIKNFYNIDLNKFFICYWCTNNVAVCINMHTLKTMCIECFATYPWILYINKFNIPIFIDYHNALSFFPISPEILNLYYPDLMKNYYVNGYKFIKNS